MLPAVPDSVRISRRLVRDLCLLMGLVEVAEIAELLTGEVTTNVVLHTRTPILRMAAEVIGGKLRVCVSDSDPHLPIVREPSQKEQSGRGLVLVKMLSKEWGAVQRPGGKVVWFTLSTDSHAG